MARVLPAPGNHLNPQMESPLESPIRAVGIRKLVADLSLDREMLQDVIRRKL
jgi:hypothetical protein